ncbi:MAG: DUF3341 domain-containing protein [Myxococcales bacterium]|nr:DUF3341 domain-containing protein [Myxococcales bacterium]
MKKAVMGIVEQRTQAEAIVEALRRDGFSTEEISVLFPDKKGTKEFAHEHHTKAPEGAAVGAGTGGVVGGTLGLLAGIGALAIPGLGPFIAAGPILATLSGIAVGGTVGGVAGALVGLGIPEIEAKVYESKLKGGNLLLAVHTESNDELKRAERALKEGGAQDVCSTGEASVPKAKDPARR